MTAGDPGGTLRDAIARAIDDSLESEDADAVLAALREHLSAHPEDIAGLAPEKFNEHIYEITPGSWFLEHSIACKLAGLANCPIHKAVDTFEEPPEEVGRYVVTLDEHGEPFFVPAPPVLAHPGEPI